MVKMAAYTNMPEDVAALAMETEAMIASGELHPFKGPIYRQDGTMVIGEGEVLDDGTLLGMNWYVQGVDDKLPE
jgi:simple sugar transport system substrate-binding protein